jgi:hypothetical protein
MIRGLRNWMPMRKRRMRRRGILMVVVEESWSRMQKGNSDGLAGKLALSCEMRRMWSYQKIGHCCSTCRIGVLLSQCDDLYISFRLLMSSVYKLPSRPSLLPPLPLVVWSLSFHDEVKQTPSFCHISLRQTYGGALAHRICICL